MILNALVGLLSFTDVALMIANLGATVNIFNQTLVEQTSTFPVVYYKLVPNDEVKIYLGGHSLVFVFVIKAFQYKEYSTFINALNKYMPNFILILETNKPFNQENQSTTSTSSNIESPIHITYLSSGSIEQSLRLEELQNKKSTSKLNSSKEEEEEEEERPPSVFFGSYTVAPNQPAAATNINTISIEEMFNLFTNHPSDEQFSYYTIVVNWNNSLNDYSLNHNLNYQIVKEYSQTMLRMFRHNINPYPIIVELIKVLYKDIIETNIGQTLLSSLDQVSSTNNNNTNNQNINNKPINLSLPSLNLSATTFGSELLEEKEDDVESEQESRKKTRKKQTSSKQKLISSNHKRIKNQIIIEDDSEVTEEMLGKLTDPLSLYIRSAMGSIGLSMTDAFISLPANEGISSNTIGSNSQLFMDYYQNLKPAIRAAMMEVDNWIRPFSKDRIKLVDIILQINPANPSTPYINVSLWHLCSKLTGLEIAEAININPNRGLETRFTITELKKKRLSTIDELKIVLTKKFSLNSIFSKQQQPLFTFSTQYYTPSEKS